MYEKSLLLLFQGYLPLKSDIYLIVSVKPVKIVLYLINGQNLTVYM